MTQDRALDILKTGASVFLTGEPGAGKTHTVNRYVSFLRSRGVKPAVVASTGIAATHIGGMTVHSWCGIGIADSLASFHLDRIASTEALHGRISRASVLIIDEISMLAAHVLDMVDLVCRTVRRSEAAFGGLQVVLVGDFFQLPPVSREGRKAEYAFLSRAWARLDPVVCYLEEQHRQDDRVFLSLLSAIRRNAVEEEHVETLRSRQAGASRVPARVTKLYSHNTDVDRMNEAELTRLPGEARTFVMRKRGKKALAEALARGCLSPEELRLKEGASVMFTRNNPQDGYANGTTGTVSGFDDMGAPVVRLSNGREITVSEAEWSVEERGRLAASIIQYPLRLAWAMTIHKSQGMSLDAALMDLSRTFEYGQGYVALSRVRSLAGLHLLGCGRQALEVRPEILEKDRDFREASLHAERAIESVPAERRRELLEAFVLAAGGDPSAGGGADLEEPKPFEKLREAHPKAYAKWSAEEESRLREAFAAGGSVGALSEAFGRKPGGIRSRLRKMGLLE